MATAIIQGEVLEWALTDAGVDRSQVLDALKSTIIPTSGPLSHEIEVSTEDLDVLAKITHRSKFFFARTKPPKASSHSVAANFRAPANHDGKIRELNTEERAALRRATKRQKVAARLSEELDWTPVDLPVLTANTSPTKAAEQAVTWLAWERRQQYTVLKSQAAVFSALRGALEARGVLTNLVKVDSDSFRGFSLHDERAPLILVNAAVKNAGARSFTLLHELAHLMRGVDKACTKHDLQAGTSSEAWCNRFAAAFLIPESDLKRYLTQHLKQDWIAAGDEYAMGRISRYFKASWYCTAIRLKDLGFADKSLVKFVSGDFLDPEPQGFAPGGRTRPTIRHSEYGSTFTRLIDDGLSHDHISTLDARKMFGLNGKELSEMLTLARESD
jgi:Zn-dependent peptidase ImmA (M78 family)